MSISDFSPNLPVRIHLDTGFSDLVDFLPINVSINDVLRGISAAVDTTQGYLFTHNYP